MNCPKCGGENIISEKDTTSGNIIRTYYCRDCDWMGDENEGIALWKILMDSDEKDKPNNNGR